jgi:hypothetical protein
MIARPKNDADYFHTRALEEQVAAQRASCDEASHRHEELAAMYRFREMLVRSAPPEFAAAPEPAGAPDRPLMPCR